MEKLLHYVWKQRLLPVEPLQTTEGLAVEVIDPGLHNHDAGPDFFNAKVRIDGTLWVGNVELHLRSSDWFRHHHDTDAAYNSVVLHVVTEADDDVTTADGKQLPQLVLSIPEEVKANYAQLCRTEDYPRCWRIIPAVSKLTIHSWMSALLFERLSERAGKCIERLDAVQGDWERATFITLARNFGFGLNGDAFETWASALPLSAIAHHRDNLFQVEAFFIGMAGLLDKVEERYAQEFNYLQKKFGLQPMDSTIWRYLRTRPQNFPHVRILQLAQMYHEQRTSLSQLLACKNAKDISTLYNIRGAKLDLLIINTAVPVIFAYGRHHAKEKYETQAFDLLDAVKAEDNNIVRMWQECGLEVKSAGDSQALIQLKKEYCDKKNCLRCRFGYEFLSGEYRHRFFSEKALEVSRER